MAALGALAIVALSGLLALCQGTGAPWVTVPGWQVPYPAALAGLGAVALVAVESQAPLAALVVAAVVAMVPVALLRRSARIRAVL